MMVRGRSIIFGLAFALAVPTAAFAGNFTQYSDLASFAAAASSPVTTTDFSGLVPSGPQAGVAVGPLFAIPDFGATTLQVADTAYGAATYLDFSAPSGTGNAVEFAFGYENAAVADFGFELGTLNSDGKRVDGELAYDHVNDPGVYFYTPFTFTPTGANVFVGFVGNPNVEIAGVILDQAATRHTGTALDLLDVYSVAVPEPGTWAMMLLGAGVCGAVIRRRRIVAPCRLV